MEPVCEYVANIATIALPRSLPAANVTETIPVTIDAAQALSAGGEPVLADNASDGEDWWPKTAKIWGYLELLLPFLVNFVLLDFLPARLWPANNDNNGQQGGDRIAEAIERELAPLRALVAGQERMIADLRAELNRRAHDGAEVDGAPEDPAQAGLPGEATSIAEPDGDNSIHTAGEGESEAFGVANSGPGPDDEPEQAEGSSAEGGSDGRRKRRTHRSKAGRANRQLRRAREREEEAERAEAEREASLAGLFEDAVGTPRVRLPGAA